MTVYDLTIGALPAVYEAATAVAMASGRFCRVPLTRARGAGTATQAGSRGRSRLSVVRLATALANANVICASTQHSHRSWHLPDPIPLLLIYAEQDFQYVFCGLCSRSDCGIRY